MKKLVFFPILVALLAACNNEKPEPDQTTQSLICTLSSPEANVDIDIEEGSFDIAGEALVNVGKVSDVTLKVGTEVIEEVKTVPFTYTYSFKEDQTTGQLTITLTVLGDKGGEDSAQVTVNIIKKEEEKEEEEVVVPQEVTVSLTTSPAEGEEWISDTPLIISGSAVLSKGGVEAVELVVGGRAITEVTSVPFIYSYDASEDTAEGELKISLKVTGDEGVVGYAETGIMHKKPEAEEPEVPTYETMTDARDGKVYKIVTLGDQVWMAENLAWLPEVYPSADAASSGTEKRYYVLNYDGSDVAEAKTKDEYKELGVLYNWFAANDRNDKTGADAAAIPSGVRGACPEGWHIPSKAEWQIMENWVAGQLDPVTGQNSSYETDTNMKNVWSALAGVEAGWSESGMLEENPDMKNGPRDTFGFCVKPAGVCYQNGSFGIDYANTYFWLTDMQTYGGGCVNFSNSFYYLVYTKSGYSERRGYPVRCVRD